MKGLASVFDNIELCDRYTVLFEDGDALALSEHPGSDDGFARWIVVDEYDIGQLGDSITFDRLPGDVQEFVIDQLRDH